MAERQARRAPRLVPPGQAQARVWVLDDPRAGTSAQALGIAERLGVPYRLVPLAWNWMARLAGLSRGGSLLGVAGLGVAGLGVAGGRSRIDTLLPAAAPRPLLVLSSGSRSAPVALWLKARLGCRLVHCVQPGSLRTGLLRTGLLRTGLLRTGTLGARLNRAEYDLLVISEHDAPPAAPNVLPVLGAPHRIGPQTLAQATAQWDERLDHLPHPRVVLLVGGPARGADMEPARAHALGRQIARLVSGLGGSVLASTSRRTGREASDALAAGLGPAMHLLYRWGEPGENPYLGFLAAADAVVVAGDSAGMLAEACATAAPVFVALPELGGARHRRLVARLADAGQIRTLRADVSPWPRTPLDEAGRVAAEIRRRFPVT